MLINTPFILASKSLSRKNLLKNNHLSFKQVKPICDEEAYKKKLIKKNKSHTQVAIELSKLKARSVGRAKKNVLVVGSDTIISFGGGLIEKAKNMVEAKKKIKKLSGKKHTIVSAASAYYNNKLVWCGVKKTTVKLRKIKNNEIDNYLIKTGTRILNCVGCYQIEKNGPNIIENIKGDFFNVMGFPLFPFLLFLKKFKIKKWARKKLL